MLVIVREIATVPPCRGFGLQLGIGIGRVKHWRLRALRLPAECMSHAEAVAPGGPAQMQLATFASEINAHLSLRCLSQRFRELAARPSWPARSPLRMRDAARDRRALRPPRYAG